MTEQPEVALTPAQLRALKVASDVELVNTKAAKRQRVYDANQDNVRRVNDVRLTVGEAMDNERDGYPTPVGGDRKVTLQEAIERGRITVTKGLPGAVVWRRKNPELAKTHAYFEFKSHRLGMWPAPSHEALTDSITAMRVTQRRLMIGGVLGVAQ